MSGFGKFVNMAQAAKALSTIYGPSIYNNCGTIRHWAIVDEVQLDRLGIDILYSDKHGNIYRLEEKYDMWSTGNIVIEIEAHGKAGWTIDTNKLTDVLLYSQVVKNTNQRVCWALDYKALRDWALAQLETENPFNGLELRTNNKYGTPVKYYTVPIASLSEFMIRDNIPAAEDMTFDTDKQITLQEFVAIYGNPIEEASNACCETQNN